MFLLQWSYMTGSLIAVVLKHRFHCNLYLKYTGKIHENSILKYEILSKRMNTFAVIGGSTLVFA